jgi:hypothetical protein
MRNFFLFFTFFTLISIFSFAQDEVFSRSEEEIQFNLENSYKNVFFYSQSMWMSEASFGKYHYWVGRAHAYEDCLVIIKYYEFKSSTD